MLSLLFNKKKAPIPFPKDAQSTKTLFTIFYFEGNGSEIRKYEYKVNHLYVPHRIHLKKSYFMDKFS